jgi:hypothetical protein
MAGAADDDSGEWIWLEDGCLSTRQVNEVLAKAARGKVRLYVDGATVGLRGWTAGVDSEVERPQLLLGRYPLTTGCVLALLSAGPAGAVDLGIAEEVRHLPARVGLDRLLVRAADADKADQRIHPSTRNRLRRQERLIALLVLQVAELARTARRSTLIRGRSEWVVEDALATELAAHADNLSEDGKTWSEGMGLKTLRTRLAEARAVWKAGVHGK